MTFDLVNVLILDREILSFDLLEEKDQPTKLLLLTRSSRDPLLTVNVISIEVNYIPVSGNAQIELSETLDLPYLSEEMTGINFKRSNSKNMIAFSKVYHRRMPRENSLEPQLKIVN